MNTEDETSVNWGLHGKVKKLPDEDPGGQKYWTVQTVLRITRKDLGSGGPRDTSLKEGHYTVF